MGVDGCTVTIKHPSSVKHYDRILKNDDATSVRSFF
jgi:hypothetical protein